MKLRVALKLERFPDTLYREVDDIVLGVEMMESRNLVSIETLELEMHNGTEWVPLVETSDEA